VLTEPETRTESSRAPEQLHPHPDAKLVPVMPEREYDAFRADIAARGLLVPIEITANDVVLDGRQRLRAARELELNSVPVRVVDVLDEADYMLRAAVLRRQLSESQRAALAVRLGKYHQLRAEAKQRQRANLRHSTVEVASSPPRGKTRDKAAGWAAVSARTIQDAATVDEHDPELLERVVQGELKLANAARRVRRRLRDAALPPAPPPPEGPFELIYADPPWQLGNPDGAHAPENHYPCMPLVEIEALEIPSAETAVLFLWAVASLLPEALQVIDAWGFTYKSNLIWDKQTIGPGIWFRNQHEQLLLATRGNWSPAQPEDRVSSVINAKRGRHSEKPALVYELLERMHPHASKLELFARNARPGWTAWGNEAPQ
jgi:N6-adenosine-specific RNA methylase IME4/ParB-like chromosome segregation protein Spo0J